MRSLALGALIVVGLAAGPARLAIAPPSPATLQLAGLEQPVHVVTDRYGVPHIRARTWGDLYFGWGFVSARDRLWQMLAARQALRGRLSEWYGNRALRQDAGAQLFELETLARQIWASARRDPSASLPVERYCAGVNAYLALCRRGQTPWPVEVARLRLKPGDWTPADVPGAILGMGVLLDLGFPQLAERDEIDRRGIAWVERRHRFEDLWPYATIPDSAARRLYGVSGEAARGPVPEPPLAIAPQLLAAARRAWPAEPAGPAGALDAGASDIFAVGPGRSASGRPLLANDPHLPLTTPSPLHLVHLTLPGVVDAAGACVPGMPALVSGRNARCAWGVTSLGTDLTDVYADSLSLDGKSVRWRGTWTRLREEPYDLHYRLLGLPVPLAWLGQVRRYTPHGPVLALERGRRVALSARWAGATAELDLARLLGAERAGSAAELCARFRALTTPALNFVAADRDGHVIYQAVGRVPRRGFRHTRGVLPGNGRWEWRGFVPAEAMPTWEVPAAGFVVNANNAPASSRFLADFVGYDFPQDRALRIAERLSGAARLTPADLASVQNDVSSRLARRTVPLLVACADSLRDSLDARGRAAVDTLRHWDYSARRSRVAPTLWRGWYGAYLRRSRLEGLPGLAWSALQGRAPEALTDSAMGRAERPAVAAVAALRLALDELGKLLGGDLAAWRYGRAHQARFRHDLARDLDVPGWEPAPIAVDGDQGTPCVGSSRLPWSPWVTHAPALRHVVDLAVPESSFVILPPGNAGDPRSPHARDLLGRWVTHGYVPLYLSWPRIESARESSLELMPARGGR